MHGFSKLADDRLLVLPSGSKAQLFSRSEDLSVRCAVQCVHKAFVMIHATEQPTPDFATVQVNRKISSH
jgi:hypothetical protein